MAEISTIARPYAEALLKAVKESKEEGLAQKLIPVLDTIDEIVADPKLKELASDPSLSWIRFTNLSEECWIRPFRKKLRTFLS